MRSGKCTTQTSEDSAIRQGQYPLKFHWLDQNIKHFSSREWKQVNRELYYKNTNPCNRSSKTNQRSKTGRELQLLDLSQPTRLTSGWCWSSEKHLAKEKSIFSLTVYQRRKREGETKLGFSGLTCEKCITFYSRNKNKNNVLISVSNFKTHPFSKPLPTRTFLQFTKPTYFKTSK